MERSENKTCNKIMKKAKLNNIVNDDEDIVNESLTLEELIKELHKEFKTNSVNIDRIQALMSSYDSNPEDWKKYAKFDRDR